MYLHIKSRQDPTFLGKIRILAGNAFYVWRHDRHFENRRFQILNGMLSIRNWTFWWKSHVSTIYGSGRGVVTKNQDGDCGGNIGWPSLKTRKKYFLAIHVLVPLVKFRDDPTYIFWVKCETDGRTDKDRHGLITIKIIALLVSPLELKQTNKLIRLFHEQV